MKIRKRSILSENGFTLLEITVALTLVALMALGIWSVFRISVRSWSRGMENIDASQRHRNVLDMVRKQMASAYPLTGTPNPETGGMPFPIFEGKENGMRFISLNSLQFNSSPGLTLVNYEVVQDTQGAYSLVESEERYLGQLPEADIAAGSPASIPLFGNLASCYFEYRNADSSDDSEPWVRDWDAQEQGKLPDAISMTMVSTDPNGAQRNRRIVVPVQATEGNLSISILNRAFIRGGIGSGIGPGRPPADMDPGRGIPPGRGRMPGSQRTPVPRNIPWSDIPMD